MGKTRFFVNYERIFNRIRFNTPNRMNEEKTDNSDDTPEFFLEKKKQPESSKKNVDEHNHLISHKVLLLKLKSIKKL